MPITNNYGLLESNSPNLSSSVDTNTEQETAPVIPGTTNQATAGVLAALTARQEFASAAPILSPIEAKQALLQNKKSNKLQDLVRKKQETLSRFNKTIYDPNALTPEQEEAARQKKIRESRALISDESADSLLGGAANLGLKLFGGASRAVGETVAAGSNLLNALDSIGITPEDTAIYKEIKGKDNAGIPLTEAEIAWLKPNTIDKGNGVIVTELSKFQKLEDIGLRQTFIDSIQIGIEYVEGFANDKKTQIAINRLKTTAGKAVNNFKQGNELSSIGTFLGGVKDLALKDPAAATELTVQSLPQMYILARNAVLGVTSLSTAGYNEAIQEFEAEYKRTPNDSEKAIAGILSLSSAGLDAVGAKFVLGAKDILRKLPGLKAAGIETAKATINATKENIKQASKASIKGALGLSTQIVTSKPVKSTVIEGVTEGTQSTLQQLAGKQDISKIDPVEALTETAIGAVAGGQISSVTSTTAAIPSVIKGTEQVIQKGAQAVVDIAEKKGVGDTDKVVAAAKKAGKTAVAIEALINTDLTKLNAKTRVKNIKELGALVDTLQEKVEKTPTAEDFKEQSAKVQEYTDTIVRMVATHNRLKNEVESIADSVNLITEQQDANVEITPTLKETAVKAIVTSAVTNTDLSSTDTTKVLGSTDFKDSASPEDIKILEDYKDFVDKTAVVRTAAASKKSAEVNAEVMQGSKDGKFIGIVEHMRNMSNAIALDNRTDAIKIVKELNAFLRNQKAKLAKGYLKDGKYVSHTKATRKLIEGEIAALEATITQAINMGVEHFGLKAKKSTVVKPTPEKKTEKKVELREEKITPERKTAIQILQDVNIEFEALDEAGNTVKITENIATELTLLDNKLDAYAEIWKRCG